MEHPAINFDYRIGTLFYIILLKKYFIYISLYGFFIQSVVSFQTYPWTIERSYICETSSFGRKVSRRRAVLLLGFSCSVAFYNKTMGFFNRLILYQINYEGFRYLVNDFKGLPTFFQWFMALSSWKNGFVFVLHTIQGIKFR